MTRKGETLKPGCGGFPTIHCSLFTKSRCRIAFTRFEDPKTRCSAYISSVRSSCTRRASKKFTGSCAGTFSGAAPGAKAGGAAVTAAGTSARLFLLAFRPEEP